LGFEKPQDSMLVCSKWAIRPENLQK